MVANHSGAASRYMQNFMALHTLGNDLHVARFDTGEVFAELETVEAVRSLAASWRDIVCTPPPPCTNRLAILRHSSLHPVAYEYPCAAQNAKALTAVIKDIQPDFVWVENTNLTAAMILTNAGLPWVFSHHDIQYRIRQIRQGVRKLSDLWFIHVCRRAESQVIRQSPIILTGSVTDGERLQQMGGRDVRVIPMAYNAPSFEPPPEPPATPRIIHLGSLETTANRVGMEAYLRKANTAAQKNAGLELWIVGDASRVKDPLAGLLEESGAVLKGYIADLATVLQPYDISILPYEYDTGYRTKLPLLFSYGQVIVSTRAAVAGTQIDGLDEVCIIVERVEEFPAAIEHLAQNPAERERLGKAARAFFDQHFTYDAVTVQYQSLLDSLTQ
jgi:glycosyltransferase involved in cell wall biosynthesis